MESVPRRQVQTVFVLAWLLIVGLFLFHASLIFEVARQLQPLAAWLTVQIGPLGAGKASIAVSFCVLFLAHFAEAVAWGFLLWHQGLVPNFSDGVYFSAVSMTALGYGDVVLRPPWHLLGPLAAISGILMFGCSTAFLFIVIQKVWVVESALSAAIP
jgi:hypothetical protein